MISRRQLIKLSLGASGALVLQVSLPVKASDRLMKGGRYFDAWLEIGPDNHLLFSLDKVEMGQGVVNSLVAILAEELNTDPLLIDVQLPVVGRAQRNPLFMPSWGTGASSSVRSLWPKLRDAGAMLNQRMLVAAARRWQVEPSSLITRQAQVIDTVNQRSFLFAELIVDVAGMSGVGSAAFKTKKDYQWVGRKIPVRDMEAKVTGRATYCSDVQVEDVPVAVVLRCPYPGGELVGYQWRDGERPENIRVLELEDRLVLLGSDYYRVNKERAGLNVEWRPRRALPENNDALKRVLLAGLDGVLNTVFRQESRFSSASTKPVFSATYFVPYLAHATLEPMNCTVLVEADSWTVWAPTQEPVSALNIAVKISGLPSEKVSVRTHFIGGGFGRRLKQDYVSEACLIAKKLGHSVKVLWSREDDFQHGYYRPAIAAQLEARVDSEGIGELLYRVVSSEAGPAEPQDFMADIQAAATRWWRRIKGEPEVYDQAIEGAHSLAYKVDAQAVQLRFLDLGLPTGLWRSVGNSFGGFFIESFIDELAWHLKQDPIEYRLLMLKDPKLESVLRRVRALSAWKKGDVSTAQGVACYQCFGTAVAMVVEVAAVDDELQIPRVWCVIDCGMVIDPDGIKKQVEGAINFGLCAALFGELQLSAGKVSSSNFNDYPVLRLQQAPSIHVDIVTSSQSPTGVGEPATPLIAPALCNAVFALTGERYRELPLKRQLQGKLVL